MKLFATTAAFVLLSAGVSLSAVDTQALVSDLQAQGYTRIEVKSGLNQVKVEAVRGTEKVEVVYDKATGAVLKSESEAVRPGDDTAAGVSFDTRGDDFVDAGFSDDSGDSYDDSDGRRDDRDDDRDDRNDDRDDDRDDRDDVRDDRDDDRDDRDDVRDDDRDDNRGGDDNGGDRGGDDNGGDRGGKGRDD